MIQAKTSFCLSASLPLCLSASKLTSSIQPKIDQIPHVGAGPLDRNIPHGAGGRAVDQRQDAGGADREEAPDGQPPEEPPVEPPRVEQAREERRHGQLGQPKGQQPGDEADRRPQPHARLLLQRQRRHVPAVAADDRDGGEADRQVAAELLFAQWLSSRARCEFLFSFGQRLHLCGLDKKQKKKKKTYLAGDDKPIVTAQLLPHEAVDVDSGQHKRGADQGGNPAGDEDFRAFVLGQPLGRANSRHGGGMLQKKKK